MDGATVKHLAKCGTVALVIDHTPGSDSRGKKGGGRALLSLDRSAARDNNNNKMSL